MANYFNLELDTTPPHIEVLAPNYTTQYNETEIRVVGDETFGDYQEIYIIDSSGKRHSVTFFQEGTEYVGKIYLTDYSLGILTIYARTSDEVGNQSNIASKSINLLRSENLTLEVEQFLQNLTISDGFTITLETKEVMMKLVDDEVTMEISADELIQTIEDDKEVVK